MKVALVYDRVTSWGGAERVLLALQNLFPHAPLYTSVYHPEKSGWAKDFSVKKSFLQQIPFATNHHELLPLVMPVAFESFSFDEYDLVISVTSEAAKGIVTKPHTKHICYCLTPTRYLWSGYKTYFKNKSFRLLSKPAVSALRKWDTMAASRPDVFISISQEVQKRVKKYYGRDSVVVYPPLMIQEKSPQPPLPKGEQKKSPFLLKGGMGDLPSSYFLIVSRLSKFTKYKRIDLAIEACSALGLPLIVIGEGNWKAELEKKAGKTVRFVGKVTDEELVSYYQNCKALLFPGLEDFGLTMIESQKFGKPVIAFRGGGALEIVLENKTGYFFNEQKVDSLVDALNLFDSFSFDPRLAKKQAEKFSFDQFKKQFLSVVNKTI